MKNTFNRLGIAIAIAIIAFSVTACNDGDTRLSLSGQVWEWSGGELVQSTREKMNVFSAAGGSGSIDSGYLRFSIGTPNRTVNIKEHFLHYVFFGAAIDIDNFHISDHSAEFSLIRGLHPQGGRLIHRELRGNNFEAQWVYYIFVDRDVTVSGSNTPTGVSSVLQGFNLDFMRGWNALQRRNVSSSGILIHSLSLDDPDNLKWILIN